MRQIYGGRWLTEKQARRLRLNREKKEKRRHWHTCENCPADDKYKCFAHHCQHIKKKLCPACRRNKRYRVIEPDLFTQPKKRRIVAVHMESSIDVLGYISHTYVAHWDDGTATPMTVEELQPWMTAETPAETPANPTL